MKSIWEDPQFKPYQSTYLGRRRVYLERRRYYDGTVYDDGAFRLAHKLYAQTKGIFAFLARAVDLDVALVPGVMAPWGLKENTAPATLRSQAQLYEWSDWPIVSDNWLSDGATTGEAMIKIVPGDGLVQLQRLAAEDCLLGQMMIEGQIVPMALIVVPEMADHAGELYEYAELITPAEIRTFRDGGPHGYEGNPDRYPNPLGFVPVVATNNDTGKRPTFAKAQPQLDSANELASYLADIIGRHAEPQWAIKGAEPSEMVKSGEAMWYLPAGAEIEAILAGVDIAGTLEFIREVKMETKSNLPELAFDDLRTKDQIATETLEIQLVELDAKIWKMRRRYDSGLVQAHRMAAMAGAVLGIRGLEGLLLPHAMDYARPVRPVSRIDMIRLEEAELALEAQKQIFGGERLTATAGAVNAIVRG
jgi:hypothetical protein